MNDEYRQGQLDALAAVHKLLAELGCEFMDGVPATDGARHERTTKMAALVQVSRRVMDMTEAAL